jgi:hypothetical protein
MPVHKIANMVFTTTNLYGSIRFFGQMNPLAYAIFPLLGSCGLIFARVAYSYGGTWNEASEEFRQSWRKKTDGMSHLDPRVVLRIRQLNSCRDLKINCASFYHFEKSTFTTFMYIVVENTITLLLAF